MDIGVASFVLTIIQTLVVIISVILFLYQLRQFDHNLRQDVYTKLAEYSIQINEFLLHNRSVSNQFYQKNADYRSLDDTQRDLYNYLAIMLGLYERLYLLFQAKRIDQKIWASWERWLVQVIFPLGLFQIIWRNERTMYHEDFYNYIDIKCHEQKVSQFSVRQEDPGS
jgi:hypothetical protein